MQRLAGLNEKARAHPGYRRASTLLNQTFRKASVAQRLATLQAAEWLIDVLENLTHVHVTRMARGAAASACP